MIVKTFTDSQGVIRATVWTQGKSHASKYPPTKPVPTPVLVDKPRKAGR